MTETRVPTSVMYMALRSAEERGPKPRPKELSCTHSQDSGSRPPGFRTPGGVTHNFSMEQRNAVATPTLVMRSNHGSKENQREERGENKVEDGQRRKKNTKRTKAGQRERPPTSQHPSVPNLGCQQGQGVGVRRGAGRRQGARAGGRKPETVTAEWVSLF